MIHVKRPADPVDIASLWRARGRTLVSMRVQACLMAQVLGGPSCAVYLGAGAAPAALAGLYPAADGATAWFAVAVLQPRAAALVILALRRALLAEAELWPRITAEIETGNDTGERLAAALGFAPEAAQPKQNYRVWVLRGGDDVVGDQEAVSRARHECAAEGAGPAAGEDRPAGGRCGAA